MRRLPAQNVFVFSLLAALACLVLTVWLGVHQTLWALLPGALTVWFGVDSYRAWGWSRDDAPAMPQPVNRTEF